MKVKQIRYRRSIVPDNFEPEKNVRKYEAEAFDVEIDIGANESPEEAFKLAETTVLAAHQALQEKREARSNIYELQEELDDIDDKLAEKDSLYDTTKLRKRKKELEQLIAECK